MFKLNFRNIRVAQDLTLFSIRLADRQSLIKNEVHCEFVIAGAIMLTEAIPL